MQTVSKIILAGVIGLAMASGFGETASAASGAAKTGHVRTSGKRRHARVSKSKQNTPQNLGGGASGQKRMKRSKKNRV